MPFQEWRPPRPQQTAEMLAETTTPPEILEVVHFRVRGRGPCNRPQAKRAVLPLLALRTGEGETNGVSLGRNLAGESFVGQLRFLRVELQPGFDE